MGERGKGHLYFRSSKSVSMVINLKLQCDFVRSALVKKEPDEILTVQGQTLFTAQSHLPRKFAEAKDLLVRKVANMDLQRRDRNHELSENTVLPWEIRKHNTEYFYVIQHNESVSLRHIGLRLRK